MKANQLILRCYAEKKDSQWTAFCLDFTLATQADTCNEATAKLDTQIKEYLYDCLVGEDKDYAFQLLNRKAPLLEWVKYYFYCSVYHVLKLHDDIRYFFKKSVPLSPVCP